MFLCPNPKTCKNMSSIQPKFSLTPLSVALEFCVFRSSNIEKKSIRKNLASLEDISFL